MKANRVQAGNSIDHTPIAAVAAGDVVVITNIVGIAARDIAANALGSIEVQGIFDVDHAADVIAAGGAVYWDADGNPVSGTAGSGAATATANGNTFMGWALVGVDANTTKVRVKLFGSPAITNNIYGLLNNTIADPGAAGAIPVTASGCVDLVTAAAETRTLAAPTIVGQQLLLSLKTDGGDCVVTCATTINQTGNNTITFNDAGDAVLLVAKRSGANLRWSVVVNDGAALSTV